MSDLICHTELNLPNRSDYLPAIIDRLGSFQARSTSPGPGISRFDYAFGWAEIDATTGPTLLKGGASDRSGLARVKDLMATAFRLYAKADAPRIIWQGDGAGDPVLDAFRLMQVADVTDLSPHMRRIRLLGQGLDRFAAFGNMHVRLLLPSDQVPDPVWPVAGPDGLALWPDPARKPVPRVYTIRRMDAAAGWVDIDMVLHDTFGIGSEWARRTRPGDRVGMIGPLGRPLNSAARHFIMGADETGLPAVARMLESLPPETTGQALIEIATDADRQPIINRTRIAVEWLRRDPGTPAGAALAQRMLAIDWPGGQGCFGWFAGEADAAQRLRDHWRKDLGLGRDQTLAAAYWKYGRAGLMAG